MSTTPAAPAASKVKSPASTVADQITNAGGMPPEKDEAQINNANDPSKRTPAPNTSRGT